MARAGIASRRDAEELIAAGRVKVNGKPVVFFWQNSRFSVNDWAALRQAVDPFEPADVGRVAPGDEGALPLDPVGRQVGVHQRRQRLGLARPHRDQLPQHLPG